MTDLRDDAKLSRFDPADYLTSEVTIQEYLAAAIEDGNPAGIAAALGGVARARNFSQLARDVGLSRASQLLKRWHTNSLSCDVISVGNHGSGPSGAVRRMRR